MHVPTGRDAGTKKGKGAENFKKAHCNYFELKPEFIDAHPVSHCMTPRCTYLGFHKGGGQIYLAPNAYTKGATYVFLFFQWPKLIFFGRKGAWSNVPL